MFKVNDCFGAVSCLSLAGSGRPEAIVEIFQWLNS